MKKEERRKKKENNCRLGEKKEEKDKERIKLTLNEHGRQASTKSGTFF